MNRPPPIVIYPKRWKFVLIAILSLGFVAAGVWIIATPAMWTGSPVGAAIASCGVPFFGLCLVYAVMRLFRHRPILVINDEGVFDNASAIGVGMLRWEEIESLRVCSMSGQRFLGIAATDTEAVLSRQGFIKRAVIRANLGMGFPVCCIPELILPMTAEKLMEDLAVYHGQSSPTQDAA